MDAGSLFSVRSFMPTGLTGRVDDGTGELDESMEKFVEDPLTAFATAVAFKIAFCAVIFLAEKGMGADVLLVA